MSDWRALFDAAGATAASIPIDLPHRPIDLTAALAGTDHLAFLDAAASGTEQGRYSILAWDPVLVMRAKGDRAEVRIGDRWSPATGDPVALLDAVLRAGRVASPTPASVPFAGGAVGYLAYDLASLVEPAVRLTAEDDLGLPDAYLAFYDLALVFDHAHGTWHLAGTSAFRGRGDLGRLFEERRAQLAALPVLVGAGTRREGPAAAGPGAAAEPTPNMTKRAYLAAARRAIEHIHAGDVYQINLAQRFHSPLRTSPFELFRTLRAINPAYYGAYLPYDGHGVISASPELYLRRRGAQVETRPIKGTRPRGADPAADRALRDDLVASAKDDAELAMIVDLERNDLGRVCEYGSVGVVDHRAIEALPTVFHTASTVSGTLRSDVGTVDLLRATFPGGSITGCPKIRAMQIIDALEPTRRNAYTGAIGWLGFNGDLSLNIAIRTLVYRGRDVFYQVGGGIVADSDPEAEHAETLDKAVAIERALREAHRD